MVNSLSNWQDALNYDLVNRLTRPLRQPGMMKMGMSRRIINRCDRFLNRLPLLNQQMQRWGNTNTLSSEPVPIVYAQPISLAKEQQLENKVDNSQPILSQVQPGGNIIQRKLDSSQSLPIRTVSNTTANINNTNFSNSNLANETNQFLNPIYISDSEIPVVSPLTNSEEFPKTAEVELAAFTESPISPLTITELNFNHPSQHILDATSISASEIPVVSPLLISEEFPKTAEMELAAFTESPISPATITELNLNHPSQHIFDATSISASEIRVVSPLPISEEFPKTAEIELAGLTNLPISSINQTQLNLNHSSKSDSAIPIVSSQPISDKALPIVQAKLQNYSQSSLTTVNNLNMLVEQPTQSNSYAENLISQIYSQELPIVPVQALKSQNNLTNKEISNSISPSYQNQNVTIINTQPINISDSQINQTNNQQNISSLPLVSVSSSNNPSLKPQSLPLPLAKTTPSSKSNSQQPNLSNRNSTSNPSSSSSTETSVSPIATRNVDIDVNAIASQVERKLMRKLVIESERRGKNR
ncbi:MAG: hypothetical protein RMY29_021290 [Nostoc sp. CreGUA01]|nr:hypothetical protein [Nostoc sp. CreGUA01]